MTHPLLSLLDEIEPNVNALKGLYVNVLTETCSYAYVNQQFKDHWLRIQGALEILGEKAQAERARLLESLAASTVIIYRTYTLLRDLPQVQAHAAKEIWFAGAMKAFREKCPDDFGMHCYHSGAFGAQLEALGVDEDTITAAANYLTLRAVNPGVSINPLSGDIADTLEAAIALVDFIPLERLLNTP